jgi:RNA polymerase sigma-70 factor (ECF subfamily)
MDESSRALIERMRSGDALALSELLERHLGSLHGYLRLRCGPALRAHESSMDLVQSVCCEVLADLGGFEYRGEAAFRNWLFQAAERKLQDRARHWGRAKRDAGRVEAHATDTGSDASALSCYASFCTPSQRAVMRDELARIEDAFDRLEPPYRDVIVLSRVVGLSHDEIAAEIGQTPHYTRTLLSRGLARLSTLLDRG